MLLLTPESRAGFFDGIEPESHLELDLIETIHELVRLIENQVESEDVLARAGSNAVCEALEYPSKGFRGERWGVA